MTQAATEPTGEAPAEDRTLRLKIAVEASEEGPVAQATAPLLRQPAIVRYFPSADHWMLGWQVAAKVEGRPFVARVADVTTGRMTEVRGLLDDPASAELSFAASERPPSEDEWAAAVLAVRRRAADQVKLPTEPDTDLPMAEVSAAGEVFNAPEAAAGAAPPAPSPPPAAAAPGPEEAAVFDPDAAAKVTAVVADGAEAVAEDDDAGDADPDLPPLDAYRPMPPLRSVQRGDGTVERIVTVGVRGDDGGHRIVGVRTGDEEVLDDLGLVVGSGPECGAPPGPDCAPVGGSDHLHVRVFEGDALLWDLLVVRPSASSGINGSGVELRDVELRGKRVLERAHLPVLNVAYRGDGEAAPQGPAYRSWLHEESPFEAPGEDVAPGFRLCQESPRTILDTGIDGGDHRGVALWLDRDALVIVSQLRAGWHRYVSEWRLSADGAIAPRLAVATARHGGGNWVHRHHAYWRFDFDIIGPSENTVQEHNDPPYFGITNWHTLRYESHRPRDPQRNRHWRVRNDRASRAYSIVPGAGDGEADAYGAGDLWVLRYSPDELDDGQAFTDDPVRSRAGLDRFLSAEPTHREDVVLWYAAHLQHDPSSCVGTGPVGPDLRPRLWGAEPAPEKAAAEQPLE